MRRDLINVKDMTDKEIMYVIAAEYVDDICMKVVAEAEEIMSNEILRDMITRAAENIIRYEDMRKKIALGDEDPECWYNFLQNDVKAYKTVLYDSIFHKYGANTANL